MLRKNRKFWFLKKAGGRRRKEWNYGIEEIKEVKEIKYLGVILQKNGGIEKISKKK